MEYYSEHISKLISELGRLPGIGTKSAQRLAFFIINQPKEQVLSNALVRYLTDPRSNAAFTAENNLALCNSLNVTPEKVYEQFLADAADALENGIPVGAAEGDSPVDYVLYTVTNADGEEIASAEGKNPVLKVQNPVLWNAENPYLYTLVLKGGNEVIAKKVGFRKIEVDGDIVKLNGQPIKFKGVNRHDSSPENGYAVTYEEIARDITMIKAHNFNAVRTSHYPNSPLLLELCDEIGLYVIDETNLETHGTWQKNGVLARDEHTIPNDHDEWQAVILDRAKSMLERDKNHDLMLGIFQRSVG